MSQRRIDTLMAERGLARSRASAAESVRAGRVRVGRDGPAARRPSDLVPTDAELVLVEAPRYVSRGGTKLEKALSALKVEVAGRDCLDVGASTGGFTDCMLQAGAARVVALDVGHGQLDWALRNDDRVTVIERSNAREVEARDLPFEPALVTVDVSFISLAKVLPAIVGCMAPGCDLIALVKPQFELARERVGKGGVVRSADDRRAALRAAAEAAAASGLAVRGLAPSGLPGPKGNRETFLWASAGGDAIADLELAIREVDA